MVISRIVFLSNTGGDLDGLDGKFFSVVDVLSDYAATLNALLTYFE